MAGRLAGGWVDHQEGGSCVGGGSRKNYLGRWVGGFGRGKMPPPGGKMIHGITGTVPKLEKNGFL